MGNPFSKEVKVMIAKIKELRRRMDEQSEELEGFNKEKTQIRNRAEEYNS